MKIYNKELEIRAKERWDSIAKPLDSLGKLEDSVIKIVGIKDRLIDIQLKKRALVIMCGDHGVVTEGVTQTNSNVTKIVTDNFALGQSTVCYMAEIAKVDVYPIDIGIDSERYLTHKLSLNQVTDRKIARGTQNIKIKAAMTREECETAVLQGYNIVKELVEAGYDIIATGEMGIGNTTSTSALAAAFFNLSAIEVTSKGAGLSKDGIDNKIKVVEHSVNRMNKELEEIEKKGKLSQIDRTWFILTQLGGFDICGIVGLFLGGARYGIPIIIDGAISAIAAVFATSINENAINFMLPSHNSDEVSCQLALKYLGLFPLINGNMCLGEGTGAVAVLPLIDMAINVFEKMGTFNENDIEKYVRFQDEE